MRSSSQPITPAWPGIALALAATVAFALAYFSDSVLEHYDFAGDNQQVLATIVADLHPGYFALDPVLGDAANYAFYRTAFTRLVTWTYRLVGNPGVTYGLIGIPVIFLHVFGFYLLGRRLFGAVGWALVLAVAETWLVRFSAFGEWWGIQYVVYARSAYACFLPYLLLGAIDATRLRRQALVMLGAGLATYLHPVSGPIVGFALWAAMASADPGRPGPRLRNAALTAIVFLALIAPFALRFVHTTDFGTVESAVLGDALYFYYPQFVDLTRGLGMQLSRFGYGLLLLVPACAGLAVPWRRGERRLTIVFAAFAAALAVAAVIAPLAERRVAAALGRIPFEIDFVRNIRYFAPIVVIGLVYAAHWLWDAGWRAIPRQACRAAAAALLLVFAAVNPGTLGVLSQLSCDARARLGFRCVAPEVRAATTAMYREIRRSVPRGALVYLGDDVGQMSSYGVRIYSLRPVAWSHKGGSLLLYSNPTATVTWWRRLQDLTRISRMAPGDEAASFDDLMASWGVRYVVLGPADRAWDALIEGRILYRNDIGRLVELRRGGPVGPGVDEVEQP